MIRDMENYIVQYPFFRPILSKAFQRLIYGCSCTFSKNNLLSVSGLQSGFLNNKHSIDTAQARLAYQLLLILIY